MLQRRPNTFAQTILSLSFFACDKAADHTFRFARHPPRIVGKHFVAPPNCLYSGRFNQPLGLELESYFFNSTDQLRTKLSGAGVFR